MNDEKILFQNGEVTITSTKFVFKNRTFSANDIATSEIRNISRRIWGGIVLMIAGGLLFLLVMSGKLSADISRDAKQISFILPILAFVGGLLIVLLKKASFGVILIMKSGLRKQPFVSTDFNQVNGIINAIKIAISK